MHQTTLVLLTIIQRVTKKNQCPKMATRKGSSVFTRGNVIGVTRASQAVIPQEKKYELDQIALSMGHEVIRLPPYHCQYNSIELIWAQVKGKIAEENTSFKMVDVEKLAHDALDSVTVDDWKRCETHCNKLQGDDYVKEGLRDEILEPIFMTIHPDDSSESEDDDY